MEAVTKQLFQIGSSHQTVISKWKQSPNSYFKIEAVTKQLFQNRSRDIKRDSGTGVFLRIFRNFQEHLAFIKILLASL